MVQLSYLYMNAGKTIALTIWTIVGKVMPLLFNMLSRLVMGEGSGTPLQYCCLENPRDGGAWTAGFSSYDGEFRLPLVLAQASPIFHSSCEGKLGIALE